MKQSAFARRIQMIRSLITIASVALVVGGVAQEPAKVGPAIYKQKLDNERARVFEINFKPGAKIGMHSHPDHVVYVVMGGTLKIVEGTKAPVTMNLKPGDTVFIPAQKHWAQNVGKTHIKSVVVELK
jgi:quercetin dioxygenase-like cupin family protein